MAIRNSTFEILGGLAHAFAAGRSHKEKGATRKVTPLFELTRISDLELQITSALYS
jgi:hypothetical protein